MLTKISFNISIANTNHRNKMCSKTLDTEKRIWVKNLFEQTTCRLANSVVMQNQECECFPLCNF